MRAAKIPSLALITLTCLAASTIPAGAAAATPSPRCNGGTAPVVATRVAVAESRLVRVRIGRHRRFDRVVFDFRGAPPASRSVRYVRRVTADGSGARVPVAGRAFLQVVFTAAGHTESGARSFPLPPRAKGFPTLRQVAVAGDFEGNLTFGIGLRHRAGFRVFDLAGPDRVVIDVAHC